MEYLLPALVTLITVFFRWAVKQFGMEMGKAVTLVLAFLLSGAMAFLFTQTDEMLRDQLVQFFALQMAYYEVLWKRVLMPVFNKVL